MSEAQQSPVVRVTVGDESYDIDFSDLNAIDARDFKKSVGFTLASALHDSENADLHTVAGIVWLHRRRSEPGLRFEDVAKSITFTTVLGMGPVEVEPDPET